VSRVGKEIDTTRHMLPLTQNKHPFISTFGFPSALSLKHDRKCDIVTDYEDPRSD